MCVGEGKKIVYLLNGRHVLMGGSIKVYSLIFLNNKFTYTHAV